MNIESMKRGLTVSIMHDLIYQAREEAENSECLRKKVGAILYDADRCLILGRGYGGSIRPCSICVRDVEEWRQDGCWSVHSELRAIIDALNEGERTPDDMQVVGSRLIMFVTHGPCDQCLKYMEFFGIGTCVFDIPYHDNWKKWEGRIDVYSTEALNELL